MKPITLAALLATLLVSCSLKERNIKTKDYEGKVFAEYPFEKRDCFVLSDEEVAGFESALKKDLEKVMSLDTDTSEETRNNKAYISHDLHLYKRRYFGFRQKGQKCMEAEFFHANVLQNGEGWKSSNWSIDGGGAQIWYLQYNLETRTFARFYTNAPI